MKIFTMLPFSAISIIQDVLLVCLIIRGRMIKRERTKDTRSSRLSFSSLLLSIGAFCGGLLSIPVTIIGLGLPDRGSCGAWYFFEGVFLGCIALVLVYCNSTVTYDDKGFTASNLFGMKHHYGYGDISGIFHRGEGIDTVLYCGRRKIRLDFLLSGRKAFLSYANRAYYERHKKRIPKHRPKDPMNGNLDTPWFYLFFSIFCFGGAVFFIVLSVSVLLPPDDSIPKDAEEFHISFSSYKIKKRNGDILLYASDYEKPFEISWTSGYERVLPDPETLCGGKTFFVVADEETYVHFIYAISDENHDQIISAYDRNTAYRNYSFKACIFLIAFGIIGCLFSVTAVLVGRHPERYSARFRRLFYQDGAWTVDLKRRRKY